MNIIFILLPLSLALGALFLIGYFWSVKNGQYEDVNTPAVRILHDEEF